MAREKAPQLSFTRIAGVKEVACSVCNHLSDTPIEGNRHFAAAHPEKLWPTTMKRLATVRLASTARAPRPAAKNVKAKAASSVHGTSPA
jgi:hypothetical protein